MARTGGMAACAARCLSRGRPFAHSPTLECGQERAIRVQGLSTHILWQPVPELPEVETVRTELEPALTGRTLGRVEILDTRLVAPDDPRAVAADLEGERVARVGRRG